MKLRVLCIQLGVGMEDIGVSAECRSHLSLSLHPHAAPLPPLRLEFLISQGCVYGGGGGGGVCPSLTTSVLPGRLEGRWTPC